MYDKAFACILEGFLKIQYISTEKASSSQSSTKTKYVVVLKGGHCVVFDLYRRAADIIKQDFHIFQKGQQKRHRCTKNTFTILKILNLKIASKWQLKKK